MTKIHRTHNWPAPTGPMLATTTPPKRDTTASTVWFVVAAFGLIAAGFAYVVAASNVEPDNPFMRGDQSQMANYSSAIVLAIAGAVALLIGVIYSTRD